MPIKKGEKSNGSGRPSVAKQAKVIGDPKPPKMPDGLGEHAAYCWRLACDSLPHILRGVDEMYLRGCCEAYGHAMEMMAALSTQPLDKDVHTMAMASWRIFDTYARQIGLTPSSRRIVKPADDAKEEAAVKSDYQVWAQRGGLN